MFGGVDVDARGGDVGKRRNVRGGPTSPQHPWDGLACDWLAREALLNIHAL